jgi:hypothetical protein
MLAEMLHKIAFYFSSDSYQGACTKSLSSVGTAAAAATAETVKTTTALPCYCLRHSKPMERATPPSWAEGDPGVLAEQFVNITKDKLSDYRTKYYALVATIAAASIHNVLTTSPAGSRQQQIENIKATAAAVVQRYRTRARRGGNPDAARAQPTPAALQKLDLLAEQVLQQLQQQQQPEPQLITAAFEVRHPSSLVLRQHPVTSSTNRRPQHNPTQEWDASA